MLFYTSKYLTHINIEMKINFLLKYEFEVIIFGRVGSTQQRNSNVMRSFPEIIFWL